MADVIDSLRHHVLAGCYVTHRLCGVVRLEVRVVGRGMVK